MRGSSNGDGSALDVNSRGDAVVAWFKGTTVYASFARRGGAFGRPIRVGRRESAEWYGLTVDLDERGNAVLAWIYDDGAFPADEDLRGDYGCCDRLVAAVKPARRGRFGAVRKLSAAGLDVADYEVAAGGGGGGVFWNESLRVKASFAGRSGALSKAHVVAEAPDRRELAYDFREASIAFLPSGAASMLYADEDDRIREVLRSPRGRYGSPRTVGNETRFFQFMRREVDARGNEVVAWTRDPTGSATVRAARRRRGGKLGAARNVSREGSEFFALAVAPNGRSLIAWLGDKISPYRIGAASAAPGAGFGPARRVATSNEEIGPGLPAIGANGNGMVVWRTERARTEVFARPWRGAGPVGSVKRLELKVRGRRYGPYAPKARTDGSGRTWVVWDDYRRIGYARYRP